jgi:hypothetical protein
MTLRFVQSAYLSMTVRMLGFLVIIRLNSSEIADVFHLHECLQKELSAAGPTERRVLLTAECL